MSPKIISCLGFFLAVMALANAANGLEFYFNESSGEQSVTASSYTNKTIITFTPPAAANYTIIATAEVNHSSAAAGEYVGAALAVDNAVYHEILYRPKDLTDWFPFSAVKRIELSASRHSISIQWNATSTGFIRNARIFVMQVDAQYNESEGASTTTSTTPVEKAALVFTPASAGSYLIIASANIQNSATGRAAIANLYIDGTEYANCRFEQRDLGNSYGCAAMKNTTLNATQTMVNLTFNTNNAAGTATIKNAHLIAIRLDAFDRAHYNESESETDPAVANRWYNKTTNQYTSTPGTHLVLGSIEHQASTSNSNRVTFYNGTTKAHNVSIEATDVTDWATSFFMTAANLTAAAQMDRIEHSASGGTLSGFSVKRGRLISILIENSTPVMRSVSASASTIKGGNVITITGSSIDDPNGQTLNVYCSESSVTPNATNTICTGGTTVDTSRPYELTCTYATSADDATHTTYCRAFDGDFYSAVTNTSYITDSTPPVTTVVSVAGDTAPTYYDTANDGWTNITISGEAGMACRWGTSDAVYASMTNDCSVSGAQATCTPITTTEGLDAYNFHVSCQDSLGNSQNTTQNLDITSLVTDWTAPTTSDDSSTTIATPPYTVTITESDNLAYGTANIQTLYCMDTSGACAPSLSIDSGETVTFSNRGANYLRYRSTDPAGNAQSVQNKSININRLPVLTSASDDATTIRGGSNILITTVSSDADSQTLKLFVCNSTSATSAGCGAGTYCSNTTGVANATCSLTAETDSAAHAWYAFLYDSLNESSAASSSGTYTTDSTTPTVTIINPENKTYSENSVAVGVSLSEAGSWGAYSLDGAANATMSNSTLTFWSATISGLSNGGHTAVFYANDSSGNMGTNNRIFSVDTTLTDTTPPSMTINFPANSSYQRSTSVWINITTDENASSALYSLDGAANATMSNSSMTAWYVRLTGLSDETLHNVTVYANDTSTNRNTGRKPVSFYADTLAPRYANTGADPAAANQTQNVTCSAFWTDGLGINSGQVSENSSGAHENHTVSISGTSGWTNFTIMGSSLSVGTYQCVFYSSDTAGNYNSTSVTFAVQDVTAPAITIRYPENTTYTQNSATAEILGSENLNWAGYLLDGAANATLGNVSGMLWSSTISSLSNSGHTIRFYGNDSSGNMGASSLRVFSIDTTLGDTTPPSMTINFPANNSYQRSTSVNLSITLNEDGSGSVFSLDGAANASMSNTTLRNWNYTIQGLADEILHNVAVYANDTSTNRNTGMGSVSFYADTLAPRYSQVGTNASIANESQSVECRSYWTDGLSLGSARVAENSTGTFINHTISVSGSVSWVNYTIPGRELSVGIFACIFYVSDAAGNQNSTSTTFIVRDVTAPTMAINSPFTTTYSQTFVGASITASENIKQANYSLDNAANVTMGNSSLTIWSGTVSGLSNSVHTLRFYAVDYSDNIGANSINFTVDTTIYDTTPPTITVFSPTNRTYASISVLLNMTLSEAGSNATYSLDGSANASLGNVSLTNWYVTATMSQASHNITFYATDTSTNRNTGNSSLISFDVDATAPQNSTQGYTPTTVNETTDVACFVLWTDNLGLDYGIIQHNETGTAVNTSQISLSSVSAWTNLTINSASIDPGPVECKVFAFDKASLVNSTTITFTVADVITPRLENISYMPNSTDEARPNVMINVTADATDSAGLSRMMLQYKLLDASGWTNVLMFPNSGNNYKANFTPASGNWSFRVFANDTSNNINTSQMTNLTVDFKKLWRNISTVSATKSIVKDQARVVGLGDIIINNTGDFDLNFTANSSQTWITFNNTGSNSIIFRVNQSLNNTLINVTANTTGFSAGEYGFNITIYAFTINPTFVSAQVISGKVVIQNVAGPYFTVAITSYDASVTQGDTGIALTAALSNDGTTEASGTWLNWTLPSGWTNTSGSKEKFIGFLGIGSAVTSNITVSVSSSAPTGTQAIIAFAGSAESAAGNDSKSVTVSSSSPPPAGTTVSAGGGGGGTSNINAITQEQKALLLQTSESFELVRGLNDTFIIKVTNPFVNSTMKNIALGVKGFLAQYISAMREGAAEIAYNETVLFKVIITAPAYLTKGSHQLNFTISGRVVQGALERDIIENRFVTLFVHEIGKSEAGAAVEKARADYEEMLKANFSASNARKLLDEAEAAMASGDYETAKRLAEEISLTMEKAFSTHELLQRIRLDVSNSELDGLRVDETKNLLNMALAAFEREDYQTAERRAKDAQLAYALETVGKINYLKLLIDNREIVIISCMAAGIIAVVLHRRLTVIMIGRKLEDLAGEEENISRLMREAQTKTYAKKRMSSSEYRDVMYKYEKSLEQIRELRTKLRARRVGIITASSELYNLTKEDKDVTAAIKNAQKDYFEKRSISKATYSSRMESLKNRKAEIDESLAVLEAKIEKKRMLSKLESGFVKRFSSDFGKIKHRVSELVKPERRTKLRVESPTKQLRTADLPGKETGLEAADAIPHLEKERAMGDGKGVSGYLGELKDLAGDKLSKAGEWLERKRMETRRRLILSEVYRPKPEEYSWSLKAKRDIGLMIRRIIGKIKLKVG